MTPIDHLAVLWALSLCSWGIFCFYLLIRIDRFIVKRYEQQTDLLNTLYFMEHAVQSRYAPMFISSGVYMAHLLSIAWCWNYVRKKNPSVI